MPRTSGNAVNKRGHRTKRLPSIALGLDAKLTTLALVLGRSRRSLTQPLQQLIGIDTGAMTVGPNGLQSIAAD
jgi:hypothetical protein